MAWEGYRSRLCKYNDFNVYGLFGRDRPAVPEARYQDICPYHKSVLVEKCTASSVLAGKR
jgi:hypothetical protein